MSCVKSCMSRIAIADAAVLDSAPKYAASCLLPWAFCLFFFTIGSQIQVLTSSLVRATIPIKIPEKIILNSHSLISCLEPVPTFQFLIKFQTLKWQEMGW